MSEPRYERRDFTLRQAVIFIGIILATAVLTAGITLGLVEVFRASVVAGHSPAHPLSAGRESPPSPRLQVTPNLDLAAYRSNAAERAATYGWVQREAGVVRLPLDRALDRVLEEGLPTRQVSPPTPSVAPRQAPTTDPAPPDSPAPAPTPVPAIPPLVPPAGPSAVPDTPQPATTSEGTGPSTPTMPGGSE